MTTPYKHDIIYAYHKTTVGYVMNPYTLNLMKLTPQNSAFVHGLWFNITGQLAQKISQTSTIIPVLGITTLKGRVDKVLQFLKDRPEISTLIGHSAGAFVLTYMVKNELLPSAVTRIVLLNSALLPGMFFKPGDLVTRTSVKYIPILLYKKFISKRNFRMSEEDSKKLLGLRVEQLDDIVEDSPGFILSIICNQLRRQWRSPFFANRSIVSVNATDDQMVGPDTYSRLEPYFLFERTVRITGGHMFSILNYRQTLESLDL